MKKYITIPGYVSSQNDDDTHYIGHKKLIDLYGVNPNEVIQFEPHIRGKYIILRPQYNGDYTIPTFTAIF